ncbi:MAG: DHH family phosphoesterase [Candidatus Nanoarchaeia archaeon]|nr:DHH family phosphoesterase [Candidatus Nanoarchaeia archaeon]
MDILLGEIKEAVKRFRQLPKKPIRIISQLDADGISSAAILIKALTREEFNFSVSFTRQLDYRILDEIKHEDYETFFFLDLGSAMLKDIEKRLKGKNIFVLDHHMHEDYKGDITNLNPSKRLRYEEVSAAGIVYLFAKEFNKINKDLGFLAIVGALGDNQEKGEFSGVNKKILDETIENKEIFIKEGFYFLGSKEKAIYKAIQYCFDPYIPEVTGKEENAIRFLEELGINIKKENNFRKVSDLSEDELKKIITAIILKRIGSEESENISRKCYCVKEIEGIEDLREFSTMLNACARLNKTSLGVSLCLDKSKVKEEGLKVLEEYRSKLGKSLDWFYKNKEMFIEGKNYVIIHAGNNINISLVGVVASIISHSNIYEKGKMVLIMAHDPVGETKISGRVSGGEGPDIRSKLLKITKKVGDFVSGGHTLACGAVIPQDKEKEFIETAQKVLSEEE